MDNVEKTMPDLMDGAKIMEASREVSILIDGPRTILLDGKPYSMRRLDTRDVFAFANMMTKAVAKIPVPKEGEEVSEADDASSFFDAILGNPNAFAGVFAPVIGIKAEEFVKLSPKATMEFLAELEKSEDLAAFFDGAMSLMKVLGSLSRKA